MIGYVLEFVNFQLVSASFLTVSIDFHYTKNEVSRSEFLQ